MSKIENLRVKLFENIQKIQLFELNNSTYSKITINKLKKENIKLKLLLNKEV